jgi:hypothetical protein
MHGQQNFKFIKLSRSVRATADIHSISHTVTHFTSV